jgi:class 3 adenylate cyclase
MAGRSAWGDGELPTTQYVSVGDADVAYQVLGEGPDLLHVYGIGGHVDLGWAYPPNAELFHELAAFSRLIRVDRRGIGASDRFPRSQPPTWEAWTEDITTVLDTVGSERAAIWAELDAGPVAILFAAMHPERVSHLILGNTTARYRRADDYPEGADDPYIQLVLDFVGRSWGTTEFVMALNDPNVLIDRGSAELLAQRMRASATPGTALAHWSHMINTADARHALAHIQCPTLVMRNTDNAFLPMEQAQYLVEHIPNAEFVEIPGNAVTINRAQYQLLADVVSRFLTGQRRIHQPDRALATVLFTDVVGSTVHAAELGDRAWTLVLQQHYAVIARELDRFGGRRVNPTGDGVLATFDGPGRAVRCAQAIAQAMRPLGIQIRAGLHCGEIEIRRDSIGGIAVHIGQRVSALAGPGEVLVSRTVADLVVGSGIEFVERGEHELRGVPGRWAILAVRDDESDSAEVIPIRRPSPA